MKSCLSTLFDQYDGLWGVFAVKKDTLYTSFDLQGHSRVQIFTYKDVSVCNVSSPNFHMFYDKSRVSTQMVSDLFDLTVWKNLRKTTQQKLTTADVRAQLDFMIDFVQLLHGGQGPHPPTYKHK